MLFSINEQNEMKFYDIENNYVTVTASRFANDWQHLGQPFTDGIPCICKSYGLN